MNVAILHKHFDSAKLAAVTDEMRRLGAPRIKAVWMECYGHWAALEGCHRIRSAKLLGLRPEIEEVEYSDDLAEDLGLDAKDGVTIADICDESFKAEVVTF